MDYISTMHRYDINSCKIATSKLNDDAKLAPAIIASINRAHEFLFIQRLE